jgi:hypothetical protein
MPQPTRSRGCRVIARASLAPAVALLNSRRVSWNILCRRLHKVRCAATAADTISDIADMEGAVSLQIFVGNGQKPT